MASANANLYALENESGGEQMWMERHHQPQPRAMRKSSYLAPTNIQQTDLRSLLSRSTRGDLEAKQLSFLDKGSGLTARSMPIWYAGEIDLVERRAIAVIGTRKVSDAGRKRANRFARELTESGVVVVSGLAEGVDTQALTSAIGNGGKVIAVIGTPIDRAYPAKNGQLQEEIYENHLLISQFEPGERTFPSSFPARNRTMAAISDASVIIEASESSGTLHQASECVRLGRWLAISKSVVEDPALEWPSKFLDYEKCIVLESTEQLLDKVYGAR